MKEYYPAKFMTSVKVPWTYYLPEYDANISADVSKSYGFIVSGRKFRKRNIRQMKHYCKNQLRKWYQDFKQRYPDQPSYEYRKCSKAICYMGLLGVDIFYEEKNPRRLTWRQRKRIKRENTL